MKNLIITFFLLFCVAGTKAQINLEHTYNFGETSMGPLIVVHFSSPSLGYKYASCKQVGHNSGIINLYNLNHSLYKSITIPSLPHYINSSNAYVWYISDSLFNTNAANIEYVVDYQDTNFVNHIYVFDDAGNTLFSKDSASVQLSWPDPYTEFIFYTPNGYKMVLNQLTPRGIDSVTYVYSLPGALPCSECSNGNLINSIGDPLRGSSGSLMNAYPDPAKNSTTINYELPDGINQGTIVFYNLQGKQVKTYTVDRTFNSLLVSTADLASGTYFYVLRAGNDYVGSKKMVIIK